MRRVFSEEKRRTCFVNGFWKMNTTSRMKQKFEDSVDENSLFENYLRIKILNKITMKYVFLEREQRNRFVLEDLSRVNPI